MLEKDFFFSPVTNGSPQVQACEVGPSTAHPTPKGSHHKT